MSEVIQPAPGQSVITTDRHNHDHGHRGHDGHSLAEFIALTNDVERSTSVNGDRINTGVQVTGDRVNAVGAAGALAAGRTDQLVGAGFGGVHDRLCDAKAGILGAVGSGFAATALAECKTQDAVAIVDKNAVTLAKDNLIAMNVGFSAVNTQAAAIGSAAQVLATGFANQSQNTATQNFNLLTGQATENTYKVLLDSQKNASAAQLEAEKNHNAVMLKLCECCGETQRGFQASQAQAAANLAAITATSVAGTQRILDRMCDDKNADLRAQLVATQRLIPVTIPVGAG